MNKALSTVLLLGLILVSVSAALPTGWAVSEAESQFKRITNLNAPNWILGNQSFDDYTNQIFKFVTTNNATKCPIETPFVRGSDSKCINCVGDKPVFDLFAKDCTACPAGTQLNTVTHKCEPFVAKCGSNYVWNEAQQRCICPDAFPVDLGCECVTCLEPYVWNEYQRTCKLRCEESHLWNKERQICECPASAHEVNGECLTADAPFEWRSDLNTYQLKVNSCGAAPTVQVTPVAPTVPVAQTCTSNFIWDSQVQKCVCPSYLPFNDGTQCIACDLPKYWDHDLRQCLYCPTNKVFNTNTRACQNCPTDRPLFRNFACEVCPANTTYDPISNSCQDNSIDPSTISKVPVYTTTVVPASAPVDYSIDPSATPKVPIYTTTTTPVYY